MNSIHYMLCRIDTLKYESLNRYHISNCYWLFFKIQIEYWNTAFMQHWFQDNLSQRCRHNESLVHLKWLTHLTVDKMAAISQTIFSDAFSWMKNITFWLNFSPESVSKGPTENDPALVQIRAWLQIGDKPLSEPILTRFTDAYMRHYS